MSRRFYLMAKGMWNVRCKVGEVMNKNIQMICARADDVAGRTRLHLKSPQSSERNTQYYSHFSRSTLYTEIISGSMARQTHTISIPTCCIC